MSEKLFTKVLRKGDSSALEIELQMIAARHGLAPHIISVFQERTQTVVRMQDVDAPCLADLYGENPQEIPLTIWKQIYRIVTLLFDHEGIEYVDLTPYNFLERPDGRIVCIDFSRAFYTTAGNEGPPTNWFLAEFINEENGAFTWNPDSRAWGGME